MFTSSRSSTDLKPTNYKFALRGLAGNLTVTRGETRAWYVEREVPWQFRSNAECEASLRSLVRGYATLAGRDVHRRISLVSYPVSAWARSIDLDTPIPADPEQWARYLQASQQVLYSRPMAEPLSFLGVEIGKPRLIDRARDFRRNQEETAQAQQERLDAELSVITDGLSEIARPATQREMEWLLHRSIGLGLPAPDAEPHAGYDALAADDLAALFEAVEVDPGSRFARSLRVVGAAGRNGPDAIERHVVILSVGRMEAQRIPEEHGPWLARALQHAGHVEVSVRGRIQAGPEAAKAVQKRIDRILDQHQQRVRHGMVIPPAVTRTLHHAIEVQDTMQEAHRDDATQTEGWVRLAVDGTTEKEAMSRAVALRRHMEKVRIALPVMNGQAEVYREFIPGEPGPATTAHRRRLDIKLYAAAVPQASGAIGDGRGFRLGYTIGSTVQSPFFWDLHYGIEHLDQGGATPLIGEKGSGKSFLLGALLALSALRGNDCTGVDPAGQLAAICRWEPIRARAMSLHVLDSNMSPYGVFPKPSLRDFEDRPEVTSLSGASERGLRMWEMAQAAEEDAKFERRGLVLDLLRGILPQGVAAHPATEQHLMAAIRRNGGDFTGQAAGVIRELERMKGETNDPHVGVLFDVLTEMSEHPRARNWINARYEPDQQIADAGLLMLTMEGLQLPQLDTDPAMWSVSERLSLPLLNLAVHYAYSRIYRKGDRRSRKVLGLDETHYLDLWPSGLAFARKVRREDRRWNIRSFFASQDAGTTVNVDNAGDALVNDVIAGHCNSTEQQAKTAALLKVHPGFAPNLGRLRPLNDDLLTEDQKWRDFIMRINGRVSRVRFTLDEDPELRRLLNTTPSQPDSGRGRVLAEHGEWFVR